MLAALAQGPSRLSGLPQAADTEFLFSALQGLGMRARQDGDSWEILGGMAGPPSSAHPLDMGESATNLRFMLALCAVAGWDTRLQVQTSLAHRPQEALLSWLQARKVAAVFAPDLPGFSVAGSGLHGPEIWDPPVGMTSQLASGLLLAAPLAGGAYLQLPTEFSSAGYFAMTVAWARAFRGKDAVQRTSTGWLLSSALGKGQDFLLPADASAASFFLARSLRTGQPVRFERGWDPLHPETLFFSWLQEENLLAQTGDGIWQPTETTPNESLSFDLAPCPDCGPALAVVAALLPHGIRVHGVARLRGKESDRRQGMLDLVHALGGEAKEEEEDMLWLHGQPSSDRSPHPVGSPSKPFPTQGDHRLAMAAGIAGLEPDLPQVVEKSFRGFWGELGVDPLSSSKPDSCDPS